MQKEIIEKLNNATLSEKEFKSLPYLDRKTYKETAQKRFSSLDTHLDKKHIDWKVRIRANNDLALCLRDYINKNLKYLSVLKEIKIIELGSSLGAITTLFALRELDKFNLLNKTRIWLLDMYKEGLIETKKIDFNLGLIIKEGRFGKEFDTRLLRKKLKSANLIKADILKLPKLPQFDIILSGFTHHHLNLKDKMIACKGMENIAKRNSFIGVGDLFFNYKRFITWLKKHKSEYNKKGERIPYAVESFIPVTKHTSFFRKSNIVFKSLKNSYYVFYLKKN